MLKVGHVTEEEEVMSFFSSFSFAKALEIAPWSRDKQSDTFCPFTAIIRQSFFAGTEASSA